MQTDLHAEQAPVARRYDYGDRTVIVADFGPGATPSVDAVDGTAILVAGEDQHEFDLPDGDVRTVTRNGVVTVEVKG